MGRELPTVNIEGTDFVVDVYRLELREKGDQKNIIPFENMRDVADGYTFEYSLKDKNLPAIFDIDSISVKISEFVKLDPAGMAARYKYTLDEMKGKSDFELMVDQKAFDMRVKNGILPTIDIAGHTFYVDIRMDMLRPKDDFLSKGIVFDQIDHYFSEESNAYIIPYDPVKHQFKELDYENLFSIPKDLIAVEFPFQRDLDPIGWNRQGGWDLKDDLKQIGLKLNFKARTVPWNETFITQIIKDNIEKKNEQLNKEKLPIKPAEPSQHQQGKKGRSM